jgi:pyrroline-5-carboxylate reductase
MILGFIGAGKMAQAVAAGLVRSRKAAPNGFLCSSRTAKSGRAFLDLFPGSRWTFDNSEVVRESDLVILALKPQQFPEALPPFREASAGKLFLSLAAGVTLEKIAAWLDPSARIIRAMPNLAMQVGAGATVYAGTSQVTEQDYHLIERVLFASGKAWRVEEKQIDAITALSGSGPAYVFHFIDALAKGGAALGIPAALALDLARQTVLGSAQLAAQSPLPPLELAAQVKSPRGTTLAGCAVLEDKDALNQLVARAMAAAKARAEALARGED